MGLKYKRVVLKLSGEALAGNQKTGLDFNVINEICASIKKCVDAGAEIGIVVGGGNFWRGRSSGNMDRTRADHIGMLATTMNALAVADAMEALGVDVRVQTAISMQQIAEGKVGKYYSENCLLEQTFVKDGSMNVKQYVDSVAKAAGTTIDITGYVCFERGEGIEKKADNFAEEIASMIQ